MLIVDPITLDPAAFLPGGAELDLSGAGFRVLDADFGDADVEVQLQRQALGEIPTDYHPPNTVTTLKLGVRKEGEVDLPTAAHMLAQKVGEINEPGTEHWLQRDFDYKAGGEFAGPLGKRVYKATLQGLGGWQRGDSPDVVLTLITGPYWYVDLEAESAVFESAEGARELIATIAETLGTAPGLIRYRITNLGEADLRGLILASECRDHPQDESADTTAALAYDAVDLTAKGGSAEAEREGFKVLRHSALTAGWLTILDSEHGERGHWTHKGVRRPYMWIWDPGSEAGDVQLKARWRTLGSLQWSENRIVPTPLVDGWALIDLGECRPEPAALGDERWQLQVQARAVSGAGAIDLQRLYPFPTEQFMVVKAPDVSQAADTQSQKSPGTVVSEEGEGAGTKAWSSASNAKASDDSRAIVELSAAPSHQSQHLKATDYGFALEEDDQIAEVVVLPEVSKSAGSPSALVGDVYLWGPSGIIAGPISSSYEGSTATDQSNPHVFSGVGLTPAVVNNAAFGASIVMRTGGSGDATMRVDHLPVGVFFTSSGEDENRVCFATRGVEPRTDGVFRQHPTDDVWGQLVPEGFLPYASPSGLEGRESRFIVVPSDGDLGELPDGGDNPISAQAFTRSAYHVAREASP